MRDLAQFNRWIGPGNLLGLVRNTAPYLFERPADFGAIPQRPAGRLVDLGQTPAGWLEILLRGDGLEAVAEPSSEQREDYFALCLACHHATVATFVPTDVDSKIRGVLWQYEDRESLRRMFELTLASRGWDTSRITARSVTLGDSGPISGHDGERLSVLAGALGAFVRGGDREFAERAAEAIDAELARQAAALRKAAAGKELELDLLRLAAILTHNAGDLDQGISFWKNTPEHQPYRERFGRLAHENVKQYAGAFQLAARLYNHTLSAEGHRNYPLREVRALRRSPDLLLPMSPFLDGWGEMLGAHASLSPEDRAELLGALLLGCRKISNQVGYFRAIAGMYRVLGGKLEALAAHMPAALRHGLKDPEVRRHMGLKQVSFESSMRKKARALLTGS